MSSFNLPPFFAEHRRSLIIVAVLIVLLVVIVAKGHTPTTATTTTTLSGTTTSTSTTVPQGIGATPSSAQLVAVFNDMTSGSLSQARQATWHQLTVFPLTNNVALYLGYKDLGYILTLSAVPRRVHNTVTSTLLIKDSTSHYVLARGTITWVAAHGQWRLLAWPHLVAP